LKSYTFGSEPYLITIGDHVTITSGVSFVTHDGGVWVFREKYPDVDVIAPITIGNNVFIGIRSIIMPGVTIGDNCVIGAGSIVTRSIPSNYVAVGSPARCLKTIDEYWSSIESKAIHIRSLSDDQKRSVLTKQFSGK
jgi:acetyltransferase-like isoleucine patch superfamily enzyme